MTRIFVLPYHRRSNSAWRLRRAVPGALVVAPDSRTFEPGPDTLLVNWGYSGRPLWPLSAAGRVLNHPTKISNAADKRICYAALSQEGVPTAPWTLDSDVAEAWLKNGHTLIQYSRIRGRGGAGVQCLQPVGGVRVDPGARLWSIYQENTGEFRVHWFAGEVIDLTQKLRKRGHPNPDPFIRSHKRGWIFARHAMEITPDQRLAAGAAAARAIRALGLDFGAVDMVRTDSEWRIIEVNTAPGLRGPTVLAAYTNKVSEFANNA